MKFSYFDEYEARFFPTTLKYFLISDLCGFKDGLSSHFFFLKCISTNVDSKFPAKSYSFKTFEGRFSHIFSGILL